MSDGIFAGTALRTKNATTAVCCGRQFEAVCQRRDVEAAEKFAMDEVPGLEVFLRIFGRSPSGVPGRT